MKKKSSTQNMWSRECEERNDAINILEGLRICVYGNEKYSQIKDVADFDELIMQWAMYVCIFTIP